MVLVPAVLVQVVQQLLLEGRGPVGAGGERGVRGRLEGRERLCRVRRAVRELEAVRDIEEEGELALARPPRRVRPDRGGVWPLLWVPAAAGGGGFVRPVVGSSARARERLCSEAGGRCTHAEAARTWVRVWHSQRVHRWTELRGRSWRGRRPCRCAGNRCTARCALCAALHSYQATPRRRGEAVITRHSRRVCSTYKDVAPPHGQRRPSPTTEGPMTRFEGRRRPRR